MFAMLTGPQAPACIYLSILIYSHYIKLYIYLKLHLYEKEVLVFFRSSAFFLLVWYLKKKALGVS